MFWTYLISLVVIFFTIYVLFFSKKPLLDSPFASEEEIRRKIASKLDPRISKRLLNFADFIKYLTHEKTATHIGSSEMKTLRGMLSQQALGDLSPAVLRGWSRAIRDRAGNFHQIKLGSIQFQEDGKQLGTDFCQLLAEVEFKPLEKKDDLEFRAKQNREKESDVVSKTESSGSSSQQVVVCAVVVRFRKAAQNTAESDSTTPIRENVAGFHVLPPKQENENKPEPFDIMSYIDPYEIDQFAEAAVESLFDKKFSSDPIDGLFKFCAKPLQNLYDLKNQEQKEKQQQEAGGKLNPNDLPPKQRREKLRIDMHKLKFDMGLLTPENVKSYSPTITMNNAEMDDKTYATSNAKCIQARITHTGPERDCVVTLQILLDGENSFGLGVIRYSFVMSAPKKKTMLFDQDTQMPLGTI